MKNQYKKEQEYILANDLQKQIPAIESAVNEPRFTIKDIGITHRWITHWHEKGLLVGEYEEQKWRKFNMIEYVWLKMIVQMRKFNLPLDKIKKVKEYLFMEIPFSSFIDSEDGMEILEGINNSERAKEVMKSKKFREEVTSYKKTFIEFFIMDSLFLGSNYSILINSEGDSLPMKGDYIDLIKPLLGDNDFLNRSFISISMFEILSEFMNTKSLDLIYGQLHLLSLDEMKVIKALREDKIKSVNVKLRDPNKIELIEVTKEEKIDSPSKFFDLILKNSYQDIELKTQNGKIVYCKNTRKIKK